MEEHVTKVTTGRPTASDALGVANCEMLLIPYKVANAQIAPKNCINGRHKSVGVADVLVENLLLLLTPDILAWTEEV